MKCSEPGCNNPAEVDIEGVPYCKEHYKQRVKEIALAKKEKKIYHPLLITKSPIGMLVMFTDGAREVRIPMTITREVKTVGEHVTEESEVVKEIDWNTLVGAEPIDDIRHDVDLVLTAEFAERMGEVTAKEVSNYLAEHPYSTFERPDDDKARHLLDKLAEIGIVKKYSRKGRKGANIYNYLEGGASWRKRSE